jgi:hypothetical protein
VNKPRSSRNANRVKTSYDFSQGVKNPYLKRIIVSVKIENALDVSKSFICDAIVDTDVSLMVLPRAWKGKLGSLESGGVIGGGMLFLIEYDRDRGKVVAIQEFHDSDRNKVEGERLELELKLNRLGVEREVVILEAASEMALRITHRRYFEDLAELAKA